MQLIQNAAARVLAKGVLNIPGTGTKQGEAEFSVYVSHLWNNLPSQLWCADSSSYFKSGLKTFVFFEAFP